MATEVLYPGTETVYAGCGSWSGTDWTATGCAINTTGFVQTTYPSSIPIGATITAISGSVYAYTTGVVNTYQGTITLVAGSGLGGITLLSETDLTRLNAVYSYNATGLSIIVDTSTFTNALFTQFKNRDDFYPTIHVLNTDIMTVTYTPPPSRNLFFGSTF